MSSRRNESMPLQDFSNSSYHRPHDPTVSIPAGAVKPWPIDETGAWDTSEEEPVVARPSVRQRRKVLSLCVIAFTIGSLLIVLTSPYRNEFLAPGPLHSSHAQLLAGQGADRCAACHSGAANSAFGWAAHMFSGASDNKTQSELCLDCHKASIPAEFALNPHNVPAGQLAAKSQPFRNASLAAKLSLSPVTSDNQIACSACHREHKGVQDLKSMTDAQCQTCHQSTFHSFESGHPEFTDWNLESKQTIAFDHSTHLAKHYPASGTNFDCSQCHLDDSTQNVKIMAPFEQACATCHQQKIIDSSIDGFALLSLPMLDMKAIEGQKLNVGTWPLAATGDFDGALPPAMRLLLLADPVAGPILAARPASFEFTDLDPGSAGDVRDSVALAWSIKRLLYELSTRGVAAAKPKLDRALGQKLADAEVREMLGGLNARTFAASARRWFPNLAAEIRSKFGDQSAIEVSDLTGRGFPLAKVRLQEELAKNPLAGIETNPELEEGGWSAGTGDQDLLSLDRPESNPSGSGSDLSAAAKPPQANERLPSEPATVTPPVNFEPVDSARQGWIRDDRKLAIYYRLAGHEDRVLKHWIDAVARTPDADSQSETAGLFRHLTGLNSIGNCRSCHTLKRQEDRTFVVNWTPNLRSTNVGQFTSFSHRPHLVQPSLQDCSHCHQLDATVSNRESFTNPDILQYKSNFHPIQKSNCTSCHRKELTDNSCTNCHDYHVGGHKSQR